MGFSAGGHLAGLTATESGSLLPQSDPGDSGHPLRPAFAALIYPVVSMVEPYRHEGSRRNLLGDATNADMAATLSIEKRVNAQTPPLFLVHTYEDSGVPPENSIVLYQACRKAEVRAALHVYPSPGHGFGMGRQHPWPSALLQWLDQEISAR